MTFPFIEGELICVPSLCRPSALEAVPVASQLAAEDWTFILHDGDALRTWRGTLAAPHRTGEGSATRPADLQRLLDEAHFPRNLRGDVETIYWTLLHYSGVSHEING